MYRHVLSPISVDAAAEVRANSWWLAVADPRYGKAVGEFVLGLTLREKERAQAIRNRHI
jgi:hypothetical protein